MSLSKAFSQCSLSDLTLAISAHASAASALDSATADRLLPTLRNAALTAAVLLRHPLVRDRSGLKCDGSTSSERAWCGMLRDLFDTAGVDVSDAALLRVYLACKEYAERGHVQLSLTFEYHDHFLGKAMRIPVLHRVQIAAPLMLIKPALRYERGRAAPGTALHQPQPTLGCMQVALWPAQRVRFMFGFTVKACDLASTAPASSRVHFMTASRWRTCMLQHVMVGYVFKVEVRLLLRRSARCLFC